MKQILFIIAVIYTCSGAAFGGCINSGLSGPYVEGDGYSGWTDDAVPVASFAVGIDCSNNTSATSPTGLCTTPNIFGQAACTDHEWSAHDMDINTVNAGGYCWCRRTHVRVNDQMMSDVGAWIMIDFYDDCAANCARQCGAQFEINCRTPGAIAFLPLY